MCSFLTHSDYPPGFMQRCFFGYTMFAELSPHFGFLHPPPPFFFAIFLSELSVQVFNVFIFPLMVAPGVPYGPSPLPLTCLFCRSIFFKSPQSFRLEPFSPIPGDYKAISVDFFFFCSILRHFLDQFFAPLLILTRVFPPGGVAIPNTLPSPFST